MLRSMKGLLNYGLMARDGKIGAVDDFLFDDERWEVRYLVAETGGWLKGRLVLVSPAALRSPQWQSRLFPVDLTRNQIERSPSIVSDAPLARQKELELAQHYSWPVYWAIDGLGGFGATPIIAPIEPPPRDSRENGNPHLRSVREVRGYRIQAKDGEIGHVDDLIVDDGDWSVRYFVVDTGNWLPGSKVLIATNWIADVSWEDARVLVSLTRAEVENSPEHDPSAPVNRAHEEVLYDYYGRPKYWEPVREPVRSGGSRKKNRHRFPLAKRRKGSL